MPEPRQIFENVPDTGDVPFFDADEHLDPPVGEPEVLDAEPEAVYDAAPVPSPDAHNFWPEDRNEWFKQYAKDVRELTKEQWKKGLALAAGIALLMGIWQRTGSVEDHVSSGFTMPTEQPNNFGQVPTTEAPTTTEALSPVIPRDDVGKLFQPHLRILFGPNEDGSPRVSPDVWAGITDDKSGPFTDILASLTLELTGRDVAGIYDQKEALPTKLIAPGKVETTFTEKDLEKIALVAQAGKLPLVRTEGDVLATGVVTGHNGVLYKAENGVIRYVYVPFGTASMKAVEVKD